MGVGKLEPHPCKLRGTMRQPSTDPKLLEWHTQALLDKSMHLALEVDYEDPQCGWYLGRMVRGGPFVPARIYLEQDIDDETGELLGDEVLKCELMGRQRDPYEQWLWIYDEPITEAAYLRLKALAEWAKTWAPEEPINKPYQPVNWGDVPTPNFSEEKTNE